MQEVVDSVFLSVSGAVKITPGILVGIIATVGSDALTVTVKDGGSNGVTKAVIKVAISATTPSTFNFHNMSFNNLYITITGTAPSVTVLYV